MGIIVWHQGKRVPFCLPCIKYRVTLKTRLELSWHPHLIYCLLLLTAYYI